MPLDKTFAETGFNELEEGVYSLNYVILHAETESVSIANDYFEKPATLFVEDGEKYIQFALNHSQWTKELQAPLADSFVDVDVISEDEEEDTRIVEFKLDRDLSNPLEFKMHVLIETLEPVYDHRYTVRFDFDSESIEKLENAESRSEQPRTEAKPAEQVEEQEVAAVNEEHHQEDTSKNINNSLTIIIVILIIIGIIAYVVFRKKGK